MSSQPASTHLDNPEPTVSVSEATPRPHNKNREDRYPIRKNTQPNLVTRQSAPPPPFRPTQGALGTRGAWESLLYATKPEAEHLT